MGSHHKQLLAHWAVCINVSQCYFDGNWCGPFHEDKTEYIHQTAKPFYFRSLSMTPFFLTQHPSIFFSPQLRPFMFFFLKCYYQNTNFTPQPLSWVAVGLQYKAPSCVVLWCHISVCQRAITEGLTGPVMGAQWNVMLYQSPRAAQEGRCEAGARRGASAVVIGAAALYMSVGERVREDGRCDPSAHTELLLCPGYSEFLWVCPCPQPLTATARNRGEKRTGSRRVHTAATEYY